MSEWWTYRLSDFLLFSPRTYYRMLERLNEALWPAHLLTLSLACALLVFLLRARAPATEERRMIWTTLALLWVLTGWAFLWRRYSAINWTVIYILPLFGLQTLLLMLAGWRSKAVQTWANGPRRGVGIGLLALAVVLYPMIAPALGRNWAQAEVFGIAPDPTAIGTLGLALAVPSPTPRMLMVVPILWCLISGLTLWAMESPEAWVPPAAALLGISLSWLPTTDKQATTPRQRTSNWLANR